MLVTKKEIDSAVDTEKEKAIAVAQSYARHHKDQGMDAFNMVPVVFCQQYSAKKWLVMFRFANPSVTVGTIEKDIHSTQYPDQKILWVGELP